ncbi:MAG: hypothetical protein K8T91_07750 [Planctomycetes bacterium]|nr:hypothetical protein [Planctomycetota bacterium]
MDQIMKQVFDAQIADRLAGNELDKARAYLLDSLRQATEIPLQLSGANQAIHCTDVCTIAAQATTFAMTWQGFIGSSTYRDDGILVYGAHLFPLIGGNRVCLARMQDGKPKYDYAFRYLMLSPENGWEDRGWQVDEYGEFEHWYLEIANKSVNLGDESAGN